MLLFNGFLEEAFVPRFLSRLNVSLSCFEGFEAYMVDALQRIGEVTSHERVCVITVDGDQCFSVVYEWSAIGMNVFPAECQRGAMIVDLNLSESLFKDCFVVVRREALEGNILLGRLMDGCGCCRMLLLPLFGCGLEFSFLVLMQCVEREELESEELEFLGDVASVIGVQLNHFLQLKNLREEVRHLREDRRRKEIFGHRLMGLCGEMEVFCRDIWNVDSSNSIDLKKGAILDGYVSSFGRLCRCFYVK